MYDVYNVIMEKSKRKEYNKSYYAKNKYNVNRKRLIKNLNNNNTFPKKQSIQKYNLKYENGIWS